MSDASVSQENCPASWCELSDVPVSSDDDKTPAQSMLSGLGKVLSYLPGAREVGALILGSEQPCASMTASSRTFASRVTDLYYGISNEDRKAAFKEGSTEGWNAGLLWTRSHDSPARTFDVHNHACKQNAMLWKGDNEGHKYAQLRQEAVKGYTRSFGITARDEQKIYRPTTSAKSTTASAPHPHED